MTVLPSSKGRKSDSAGQFVTEWLRDINAPKSRHNGRINPFNAFFCNLRSFYMKYLNNAVQDPSARGWMHSAWAEIHILSSGKLGISPYCDAA